MELLITVIIAVLVAACLSIIRTLIIWGAYTYVLMALIPALPAIGFWPMFFIIWAIKLIFGNTITINKE